MDRFISGCLDSSKFMGKINYVYVGFLVSISEGRRSCPCSPITNIYPASQYWGITQKITYGTDTTILSSTSGIVDTGGSDQF